MLRIYGLIVVLGLLAGIGYGAYYYYNDTQQRLATLRDNNAKLEVANKQNQETIKMMKENYEKQTKLNNELSAKLKDAEVYGNELRKKLSKIDLPAASLNRPEETEKSEIKEEIIESELKPEESEKSEVKFSASILL